MSGMLGFCKLDDNIPITHLDYGYIRNCQDTKELEKIVHILRSGDEGIFPELVTFAEDKLEELNPKSKALYKDLPAKTLRDIGKEEKNDILSDLQQWTNEVNAVDKLLGNAVNGFSHSNLPPIRTSDFEQNEETTLKTEEVKSTKSNKRVAPRSYDEWDKIDVENELKKTEADPVSSKINKMTNEKKEIHIQNKVDLSMKGIPKEELQIQANKEKEKGNESFKAGDFDEALIYYNRSLSIIQIIAVFNNRAITLIKLKRYNEAIADCNRVLHEEIDNIKAYLRRGLAYKLLGKTQTAIRDFERVLEIDPENKRAKDLLKETEKLLGDKGRRVMIEEINEENKHKESFEKGTNVKMNGHVTDKIEDTLILEQTKKPRKGKRLKIVEIDNSENHETYNETDELLRSGTTSATDIDQETTDADGAKSYKVEENDSWLNITTDDDTPFSPGSDADTPLEQFPNCCSSDETTKADIESEDCSSGCRADIRSSFHSKANTDTTRTEMKCDSSESSMITDNTGRDFKVDTPESEIKNDCCGSENKTDSLGSDMITDNTGSEVKVDTTRSEMKIDSSPPPPLPADVLKLKDSGNTFYKAGNYSEASKIYTQCMDLLSSEKEIHASSFAVLLSNRAMCKSKIGNCRGCINDCNESLDLVVTPKALLRRAGAYETLEKFGHAYVDYQAALRLDSSMNTAWDASRRLCSLLRDQDGSRWREKLPQSTLKVESSRFSTIVPCTNSTNSVIESKLTNAEVTKPSNIQQDPKPAAAAEQKNTHYSKPANIQSKEKLVNLESNCDQQASKPVKVESKHVKVESKPVNVESKPIKVESKPVNVEGKDVKVESEISETVEEKFKKFKDNGNKFVQQKKFEEAIRNYSECIEIMPMEVTCYTNRALCYLKLNEPTKAEEDCSKALEMSPNNVKALFRRGQAKKMNKCHRDALRDLTNLLKLEPGNTAAKKELEATKQLWREELRILQSKNVKSTNTESIVKDEKKGKKRVKIKEVDSVQQTTCPRKEAEQRSPQKSNSPNEPPPKQKPQIRKATGFEFLQAWNNVKGKCTKEHAEVLSLIEPTQLPKVLSNKIDGDMIQEIVSAVYDHFLTKDKVSFGYNVLKYLSRADRFNMAVMFVSTKDKSMIKKTIDEIESKVKDIDVVNVSQKDISELKKAYKVT